jgi:hypothetical protein
MMPEPESEIKWALRMAAQLCDISPAYDPIFMRVYEEAARGAGPDDAVKRHSDRLIGRAHRAMA